MVGLVNINTDTKTEDENNERKTAGKKNKNWVPNIGIPRFGNCHIPMFKINKSSSSQTTVNVPSGLPQDIGLYVHTNVSVTPKNKRNYTNLILCLLLCVEVLFFHFYGMKLSTELEATQKTVLMMTGRLEAITLSNRHLKNSVTLLEGTCKKHSISKRSTDALNQNISSEVDCSNCTNSTRLIRSVRRGKHSHCKVRNGCRCTCDRASGPLSVHLTGALPEISIRDGGIISPWYEDESLSESNYHFSNYLLKEGQSKIEIVEAGLYFIYAQVYYLTSSSLNSYAISVQRGSKREESVVAVCSAEATTAQLSELSCYTAVVRYLQPGDHVFVTQRERNRRIVFRNGSSFLGLTLLNSTPLTK